MSTLAAELTRSLLGVSSYLARKKEARFLQDSPGLLGFSTYQNTLSGPAVFSVLCTIVLSFECCLGSPGENLPRVACRPAVSTNFLSGMLVVSARALPCMR